MDRKSIISGKSAGGLSGMGYMMMAMRGGAGSFVLAQN